MISPRLALAFAALLVAVPATGLALSPPPLPPLAHLQVKAFIDGTSVLHVTADPASHDTEVHWRHVAWAAPGRWNGHNDPTSFNDVPWQPVWPNSGENFFCNCDSNTISLTGLAVNDIVAAGQNIPPQQLANDLSVIGFAIVNSASPPPTVTFQQCRGTCSVSQTGNDLAITLNDYWQGGAAWYVFDIVVL